jgi:hypothetical protein
MAGVGEYSEAGSLTKPWVWAKGWDSQRTAPIPPKFSPELQQRISEAREHLAAAERELEAALSELKVSERADKKMISERLEAAFARLAAGRRKLEAILQEEG